MKQGTTISLNHTLQAIISLCQHHQVPFTAFSAYLQDSQRNWLRIHWSKLGFLQQQAIGSIPMLSDQEKLLLQRHDLLLCAHTDESFPPLLPHDELEQLCSQLENAWLREQLQFLEPKVEELTQEIAQRTQQAMDFQDQLKELHEVTIALSKSETPDLLYRNAIEFGIHKLNFDRMAIFLIDQHDNLMHGTWGTDEQGLVRDEHYFHADIPQVPFVQKALKHRDYVAVWDEAEILDELRVVGTGWNAMVALWNQDKVFGWVAADNHLRHQPFNNNLKEVFRLYGSALAQLSIRKQAEAELAKLNAELESRVAERTQELTRTNTHLEEEILERKRTALELMRAREVAETANKTKSDFLANMSHEIRTPMNAIIGMTELCLQSSLTAEQRNYLDNIQDAAHFLLGILNDVLDFSKVEAGKMELNIEPFSLPDLLDRTLRLIMYRLQAKELELKIELDERMPWFVQGDALRLGQVLTNLLSNAAKFTHQGFVALRVQVQDLNDTHVRLRFEIEDSGIGLSDVEMQRIFDVFAQADSSTTRKYGGTGLGLSIAKRLTKLMTGDISVRSQPGQGSCFALTLTLAQEPLLNQDHGINLPICLSHGPDGLRSALQALQQPLIDNPADAKVLISDRRDDLSQAPDQCLRVWLCQPEDLQQPNAPQVDLMLAKPWLAPVLMQKLALILPVEQPQPSSEVTTGELKRILLAEDNRVNQLVVIGFLKDMSLTVDIAQNGAEALSLALKHRYDLVLMDCQMPILDGYEATRRLRKLKHYNRCPIIAMTAHAMTGDREKCLAAGMNDYLTKPLDRKQLRHRLLQWLQHPPGLPIGHGSQS